MESKRKFQGRTVKCINPKCITNHESYAKPIFKHVEGKNDVYLCEFCSAENKVK
ncbi:hypothetical protein [Clostridium massiliamazoniense]|uniref:hypothetical protein n=1 Tax=Clostridium massiliamazoniense TaxID=1347366 RepID=UPI000A035207|nr:hypothetical protein [Clostridium massiliamazoniense]